MKEYIEREAAVSELNRIEKLYQNTYISNVRAEMASYCCQVIKHIPAADVVEVRHGEWISVAADVLFRCSLCDCEVSTSWDYDQDGMFDYCPCCGAKMDGGDDDE